MTLGICSHTKNTSMHAEELNLVIFRKKLRTVVLVTDISGADEVLWQ